MEEISTRFKIIELAVKLGDRETIDIQAKKLRDISLDDNLDEIITLLESNNFRQALFLMKNYSGTLKDDFFYNENDDNTEDTDEEQHHEKVEKVSDENRSGIKIITVDDLLNLSDKSKESISDYKSPREQPSKDEYDYNDDDIPHMNSAEKEEWSEEESSLPDPLFNSHLKEENDNSTIPEPIYDYQPAPVFQLDTEEETDTTPANIKDKEDTDEWDEFENENISIDQDNDNLEEMEESEKSKNSSTTLPENENHTYPAMPHIELKFKNMMNQYPPLEEGEDITAEIYPMIDKIAQEGYNEQDIWDFLEHYHRYKERGDKASAAQILLLAAATESKFAQFLLARELFSGDVIEKDHGEAFTQIKLLAEKNFPEAICDLGQFYEYGIGIDRDKKMALILYEEAADLGVERAKRHIERLKKSKGLLKFFKF